MSDDGAPETPVQIIRDDAGKPLFAALPHAEFEELLTRARRATGLEAAAEAIRSESNRLGLIPSDIVHRISQGEHPVRVWRLHRGLKAVELAREAEISPGYLSEIETGKKDGTFRIMAQIARILGVKLDDLMPVIDAGKIEEHRREVQLRDLARRISEIDSMINGTKGFDSGAVREGAEQLIADANTFMAGRSGRFDWLQGIIDKARRTIDEINSTEKSIVQTVTETQGRLSKVFSDSLARAGIFPGEMLGEPAPAPRAGNGEPPAGADAAPAPDGASPPPQPVRPDSERTGGEERPRGWFLR